MAALLSASCRPVPLPDRLPTVPQRQWEPLQRVPSTRPTTGPVRPTHHVLSTEVTGLPLPVPVSLQVDGNLSDLVVILNHLGVMVALSPEYQARPVRGKWIDASSHEVLRSAASQAGEGVYVFARAGNVFYVGPPTEADLETTVFAAPKDEAAAWANAYRLAGTGRGEATPVHDQLIVRDTIAGVQGMRRLDAMLREPRPQYALDVTFVDISETDARDLGIDYLLDGTMTLTAEFTKGRGSLLAALKATLSARQTAERGTITTSAKLLCSEGGEASLQDGQSIPVIRRPTIIDGVVTDGGYDVVRTGVLVNTKVRKVADGRIHVTLEPEISSVTGFRGDAPIVSTRNFVSSAVVEDGSIIVLGGLSNRAENDTTAGLPGVNLFNRRNRTRDRRRLFVFLQVKEVRTEHGGDNTGAM